MNSRQRSGLVPIWQFALGVTLSVAGAAHAEDMKIYRSYDATGKVPTFSDRPLDRSSRIYAVFDGKQLWPHSGGGPVSLPQLAARRHALEPLVQRIAGMHGIHAALLKAIIEVESGFDAGARSPKGAIGLMQVMPATAARYGQFNLYSPEQNVEVGARYLRDLLAMFDGNVRLAVAAYNAGENAVIRHGRRVPPYQETIRYVPMVMERYDRFRARAGS
ncbi:MAG TPA: lytic transglycosylase domain-containing protein [Noviherbaspirillum sp.]|uniref:lytic transglycosylase domain-containing protein n=1 Tax=Noviherbaspirillum sp. TaxID=1926288 RepID=UPI002B4A4B3F|nr:lytic transglycosylase domain-containing protein [Noviherbaspirillum sp.]HJV87694.1 lytic transglycosylase domain-containing protein [Noviherbaspirillum sp.]